MKRILFVDDEPNLLDGIRRTLRGQRGHWDMHFALSGLAALELCETLSFDVVVSDMCMPGMDGATLLEHIRDLYPATARLILSGYSEQALATRAAPVAYRVLTKPCNGAELQAILERVCDLQDTFATPELHILIGSIGELPSLSATCLELIAAMKNPATSASSVTRILEKDAAMTAKVLQLVNSGFFGLTQTIASVRNAVSYLGMDTLKNLALASETFRVFAPDPSLPPSFCEDMQRHMHRAALVAGSLPLDPKTRETAIVAALLHDIGGLALASRMPDKLCAILALIEQHHCTRCDAEQLLLGVTHADIGAFLLGLWGIDPLTVEAVAAHHHPTPNPNGSLNPTTAVFLADLLAHHLDLHPEDTQGLKLPLPDRACLDSLNLLQRFPEFHHRALAALATPKPQSQTA
jgi:HD-like signal output (HDOD) protein